MTVRDLDYATLDGAARGWAGQWFLPTIWSESNPEIAIGGRQWAIQNFYNADFKDEFEYLTRKFRAQLGPDAIDEFDKATKDIFTPRDNAVFEKLLAEKLAINPAGEHIKGLVGTVQVGTVVKGLKTIEVETRDSIRFRRANGLGKEHRQTTTRVAFDKVPVYAGEAEENRFASVKDFVQNQDGALNMNISAEIAILGLDAMLDGLDEGTGAAIIHGRTGAQPVDPDAATTGTLLFTLPMSDPAFAGATDQANGTVRASASAITNDSSADATGTLGYCRVSASNDGATALDDHIDGEAGTSGADFNFNTVSIVSGAVVSMTSYTVTLDQGSTAT
jgi:hypothetical protein